MAEGEPFTQALAVLWGGREEPLTDPEGEPLYAHQAALLTGLIPKQEGGEALWTAALSLTAGTPPAEPDPEPTPAQPSPTPAPTPAPEPVVEQMPYDGPALPDNATMDKYNLSALGVGETVTPALGWLSSGFGWREHPVDGEDRFHNGVDLAVNIGTEIKAFAAGTVDYIGESDIYGLYLQIRHAGGLTSFYCHCSKLCVQQGQVVAAGGEGGGIRGHRQRHRPAPSFRAQAGRGAPGPPLLYRDPVTAFGRKRVEISAGAILLWAVLFYLDEDGLVPLCLLSCALHELGHLLAIYALGGHAVCLRLSCVGAELRLSARDRLRPGAQILSALAGPLVNLAAGFAALRLAGERGWCFAGINFALAAFNLLPAGELDGGRALSCLLAPLLGADRARQALRCCRRPWPRACWRAGR